MIQRRLQYEVDKMFDEGKEIEYSNIQSLEYLDMVVHEALRINPPLSFNFRQCTRDYKFPGTDLVINKGTGRPFLFVAIYGINFI